MTGRVWPPACESTRCADKRQASCPPLLAEQSGMPGVAKAVPPEDPTYHGWSFVLLRRLWIRGRSEEWCRGFGRHHPLARKLWQRLRGAPLTASHLPDGQIPFDDSLDRLFQGSKVE